MKRTNRKECQIYFMQQLTAKAVDNVKKTIDLSNWMQKQLDSSRLNKCNCDFLKVLKTKSTKNPTLSMCKIVVDLKVLVSPLSKSVHDNLELKSGCLWKPGSWKCARKCLGIWRIMGPLLKYSLTRTYLQWMLFELLKQPVRQSQQMISTVF